MKKHTLFIFSFLLATVTFALPPMGSGGYKVFFTWKADRRLIWSDFQAKPVDFASEVAMTASSVEFSYYTKRSQINWSVSAKYFPKLSWSKKELQSDYILKHEQLHFDITELYARLLRKRLKENILSVSDVFKIKSITKNIMKEWEEEENDYDRETKHSTDAQKQQEWNFNLQQRLDALKEFASK